MDPILDSREIPGLAEWWEKTVQERVIVAGDRDGASWSYRLGDNGVVIGTEEINQTLSVIISTQRETDVHRPEFASNIWNTVDLPVNRVRHHVIKETLGAIEAWEPRVDIDSISIQIEALQGRVEQAVSWTLADGTVDGVAQATYERSI